MIVPPDLVKCIAAIHAAPHRLVLAFAGAGSLGLAWLHAIAGSSRTVLEAIDAYSSRSRLALTGDIGAPAVSAETAQAMAAWAYRRAQVLSEGEWPLLGVGLTAAIITDRQRRGADHAFLSIQSAAGLQTGHLTLDRANQQRSDQEILVSRWLIGEIARACNIAINP
ncbi:hypothetical protein [Chloroflexus sp.]|uniref:hypothetical protein n=1 Tax=Chloroflexus sp. TaxID=1904827 RepID=UPI00298F1701|nr:hypothetical protein [Chloroflexus sp.]MDW8405126.1 hypothetical protein [Chloroflexus sp.]